VSLSTVLTLVLIALVGVVSPILSELSGGIGVPDVVIEIGLGIVIGPAVLAIAHPDSVVVALSDMGLSFLMFLAGYELDLARIRGRSLQLAGLGWAMSLGLALLAAAALVSIGAAIDALIVGLALTTTALGTLLPILRDAGLLQGRFGSRMMAIGTVGEFGPILAVAVLLDNRDPFQTALLLVVFVAVAVVAALMASRPSSPRLVSLLHRHLHSSAQLPVRISVLFIVSLVYLAFRLGLDVLLGAFAAGIVVRLLVRGEDSEVVRGKLEAIGFGFLVPIFFIVSGMQFNLAALVDTPSTILRVPLFLVLFLVVRGTPALLLYRRDLPRKEIVPLAFLSATGLPLIVVITTIGVAEGRMLPVNAAALVAAGMLSLLLYPMLGRALLRRAATARAAAGPAGPAGPASAVGPGGLAGPAGPDGGPSGDPYLGMPSAVVDSTADRRPVRGLYDGEAPPGEGTGDPRLAGGGLRDPQDPA
jgi:Kef-type K+ transport system membrane component KefB